MTSRLFAPQLRSNRLRHALLSSAMLAIVAVPAVAYAQADSSSAQARAAEVQFNVPPQELDSALTRVADQGAIRIFFTSAELGGVRSNGVSGAMTVEQALSQVLAGTGFGWRYQEGRTVVIEKLPEARGAMQLGPVRVEGSSATENGGRSSTSDTVASEGTGTYAARGATIGKRAQSLREIPQSVTVVTRAQIEDQNMFTVADALRQTTGVTVRPDGNGDSPYFSARGYDLAIQYDGAPSTSTFGAGFTPQLDLALYDRAEVLRGPSGLLQGSGSPGGVVNLVKKRPRSEFGIGGALSGGSWNNFRGELDVTGPLNAARTIRARVVLAGQDRDFFYDTGFDRRWTGYAIIEADILERTTLSSSVTLQRTASNRLIGLPVYSTGAFIDYPRSTFLGANWGEFNFPISEFQVEATHDFTHGWVAKASLRYRKSGLHGANALAAPFGVNQGATTGIYLLYNGYFDYTDAAGDFNVSGPVSIFGRSHDILVGYNKSLFIVEGGNANRVQITDLFKPDLDSAESLLNPITDTTKTRTVQSGIYGNARIHLLDGLTLVIGGRLSDYSTKSRTVKPALGNWVQGAKRQNEFTPYGGLLWDVSRSITFYASYADIFLPQTNTDYNNNVLPPRVGWQAEAGVKGAFFDDGLNASLALFRIRDTNRAITDSDPSHICGSGACSMAAGLVQSQGVEAEVSGRPAPGWEVSAGYTYTHTEYLEDSSASNIGKTFSGVTPRHLLKLWTTYDFDKAGVAGTLQRWSIGGGLTVQSKVYSGNVTQGGYALLNAQLGYRISENIKATVNVNNIFDRKYHNIGGSWVTWGEPRSFIATVRASF